MPNPLAKFIFVLNSCQGRQEFTPKAVSMPPIKHTQLFDFDSYKNALKDINNASKDFGRVLSDIIKRVTGDQKELLESLRGYSALLKTLNVTQNGAADSLKKYGTEVDEQIARLDDYKAVQRGLAQIINLNTASVKELKAEQAGLKKQYENLKPTQKDYAEQVAAIKRRIGEVVPLIQQQTSVLKVSKTAIEAAEGSYKRMSQELSALKTRLQNIPGAFNEFTGKLNKSNKEAVVLAQRIGQLDGALKKADAQMGVFGRNVGNYSGTLNRFSSGLLQNIGLLIGITSAFEGLSFIVNVNKNFESLDKALRAVSVTEEEFIINQRFLNGVIDDFGLEIEDTTKVFKNFYAAATTAGITATDTREIFESVTKVAGNLRLSQDDVNGALIAFGQIASKGKVQAEELRGQIGERLPGAFSIAARAMGVTQEKLNDLLKDGKVVANDFLPKFAKELEKTFGKEDRIDSLQASINRLNNSIKRLVNDNEGGLSRLLSKVVNFANEVVNRFDEVAAGISGALDGGSGFREAFIANFKNDQTFRERSDRFSADQVKLFEDRLKSRLSVLKGRGASKEEMQNEIKQFFEGQIAIQKSLASDVDKFLETQKDATLDDINKIQGQLELKEIALKTVDRINELKSSFLPQETLPAGANDPSGDSALQKLKDRIKAQQNILEKAAQLEIKSNELLLVQKNISEEEYQLRKLDIIKRFSKKAIELENSLGQNADQENISSLNAQAMQAEIEYTKFFSQEMEKRRALRVGSLKEALEEEQKLENEAREKSEANIQIINDALDSKYNKELKIINDLFTLEQARGDQSIIRQIRYLEKIMALKKRYARDTAEEEIKIEELKEERKRQIIEKSLELSVELFSAFQELSNALSDRRIQKLEVEKERELKLAGNNASAREKIEAEFSKKIAKEKAKQARLDKALGIFNATINTAQAVIKMLANPGGFAGVALSIAAGITGALQIASIAARPIPQFKKGTSSAPAGPAIVGEEGFELIERNGRLYVTNNKASMVTLKGGEKIHTHTESKKIIHEMAKASEADQLTKSIYLHRRLANDMRESRQRESVNTLAMAMQQSGMNEKAITSAFEKAIQKMPIERNTWDERGYRKHLEQVNQRTTYLNQRYGN